MLQDSGLGNGLCLECKTVPSTISNTLLFLIGIFSVIPSCLLPEKIETFSVIFSLLLEKNNPIFVKKTKIFYIYKNYIKNISKKN